ncbi:hypothetical protein ACO0RG_000648 [Hanseniaspora osmophila]
MSSVGDLCIKMASLSTSKQSFTNQEYISVINKSFEDSPIEFDWQACWLKSAKSNEVLKAHLLEQIASHPEVALEMYASSKQDNVPLIHLLVEAFGRKKIELHFLVEKYVKELNTRIIHFLISVLGSEKSRQTLKLSFFDLSFLIKIIPPLLSHDYTNASQNAMLCQLMMSVYDTRPASFEPVFQEYLEALCIEAEADINDAKSFTILTTTLKNFFPRIPNPCTAVFMSDEFQNLIRESVTKRSPTQVTIGKQIIQVLNASCNFPAMRQYVSENYASHLVQCLSISQLSVDAASVLVKMWDIKKLTELKTSLESLVDVFVFCITSNSTDSFEDVDVAIEALSYLTLKPSVLIKLREDGDLILSLLQIFNALDNSNFSTMYGIVLVLTNMCAPVGSDVDESDDDVEVRKLRDIAQANNKEPVQKPEDIYEFIQDYMINLGFLKSLLKRCEHFTTNIKTCLSQLLYHICCCNNKTKNKLFLEHCIPFSSFLLQCFQLDDKKYDGYSFKTLLKLGINLDPLKLFHNEEYALLMTIYLLKYLPKESEVEMKKNTLFKVLLCLGNLASAGNTFTKICPTIMLGSYFSRIESLMFSETPFIQTATLQMVLNCVSCSSGVLVKFFNFENPESQKNFRNLVKFFYLKDVEAQKAVTAIVAIGSEISFIAESLADEECLVEACSTLLDTQSADIELMERILFIIENCFSCASNSKIKQNETLRAALLNLENPLLKQGAKQLLQL